MIKSQNKHGPRYGPALGIESNRGSPPYGGIIPHTLLTTAGAVCGTAVAPLIVIVKPPGRSFQALMLSAGKDLVHGHPVVSHSGLPEQRPRLTDSAARCAIPCTTVEHIAKDAVKGGLCPWAKAKGKRKKAKEKSKN